MNDTSGHDTHMQSYVKSQYGIPWEAEFIGLTLYSVAFISNPSRSSNGAAMNCKCVSASR